MAKEPKIIGFFCNWCTYTGADLAGTSRLEVPSCLTAVRVMCSSRVEPHTVMRAFLEGADGVLVGGCHPGDCHYSVGNYYTRRRVAMLKAVMETLGLEPQRLMLSWISASEGPKFSEVTRAFAERVRKLGPNPLLGARPKKLAGAAKGAS